MKKTATIILSTLVLMSCDMNAPKEETEIIRQPNSFAIVIHGGAGGIKRAYFTQEQQDAYAEKLQEALDAGYAVLEKGGISLDAVEAALMLWKTPPYLIQEKALFITVTEIRKWTPQLWTKTP